MSQTFSDTPSQLLAISYWYGSDGGTPNDLNVYWDGTLIFTRVNEVDTRPFYIHDTFGVISTGLDTLTIGIRNDPSYQALDDVSVTAVTTPEPGTLILLGSGMLGLASVVRRKTSL